MRVFFKFFVFLFCLSLAKLSLAQEESLKVVVTIKPVHSLVSAIMEGVSTPTLLLPPEASPHTFQLKPSSRKMLQQADLIIMVDPNLENFMAKSLKLFKPRLGLISLIDTPNLVKLPQRHGRQWQHHEDHEEHATYETDPHFWLSINNAQLIVRYLTDYLVQKDSKNATIYKKNAEQLLNRLQRLYTNLLTLLSPIQDKPFLVYHDGYQYFEKEFNLPAVGTLVTNPHVPLSAYGLQMIQNMIKEQKVHCVFRETEFNDPKMQLKLSQWGVKTAELDPLGARIPKGPNQYEETMLQIANTLKNCLEK